LHQLGAIPEAQTVDHGEIPQVVGQHEPR